MVLIYMQSPTRLSAQQTDLSRLSTHLRSSLDQLLASTYYLPLLPNMSDIAFRDGKVSFKPPTGDVPCETYYKVYGDLSCGQPPLVVLHGGPGSGHGYVEPFSELWSLYGIPVILYDQIGCGQSTHLPETAGDHSFWQPSLFVAELANLLAHLHVSDGDRPGFDLLGHSFGGSIVLEYAATQPARLRRLIVAGANSTSQHLKRSIWRLLRNLPVEHQHAIEHAVQLEDFSTPAYEAAMLAFMSMYLCRGRPFPPPELAKDFKEHAADTTVRWTVWVHLRTPLPHALCKSS